VKSFFFANALCQASQNPKMEKLEEDEKEQVPLAYQIFRDTIPKETSEKKIRKSIQKWQDANSHKFVHPAGVEWTLESLVKKASQLNILRKSYQAWMTENVTSFQNSLSAEMESQSSSSICEKFSVKSTGKIEMKRILYFLTFRNQGRKIIFPSNNLSLFSAN
jgi:hypothetical protein